MIAKSLHHQIVHLFIWPKCGNFVVSVTFVITKFLHQLYIYYHQIVCLFSGFFTKLNFTFWPHPAFCILQYHKRIQGFVFSDLIEFLLGVYIWSTFFVLEHSLIVLVASCGRQTITQGKRSCFGLIVTFYGHQSLKFRSLPHSEVTCCQCLVQPSFL